MAAPVNSTNSVSAGLQMTSLVAVQAQISAAKSTTNATNASPAASSAKTSDTPNAVGNAGAKTPASTTAASVTAATVAADSKPASASSEASAKSVDQAVQQLQSYFQPQQSVTLNVDKASGESYVKIVDSKTKQLILQIPSKEVLAMAHRLQEQGNPQTAASGLLVDQTG